jgi:hypothetical protein
VDIHCICGHLCGQVGEVRRKGLKLQGLEQIASKLGSRILFKIKELYECDGIVKHTPRFAALSGAVVEFSARTGIGFAGG